jgi:hypothetical protein
MMQTKRGDVMTLNRRTRARRVLRVLALLCPLLGCEMQVPEGELVCGSASDCPSQWLCIQSRCYSVSAAANVVQPAAPKDASIEPDTAPRPQDSATSDVDAGREPADAAGHGGASGSAGRKALQDAGRAGAAGTSGRDAGQAGASGARAAGASGAAGSAAKGGAGARSLAGTGAAGHSAASAGVSGGVAVDRSGAGGS